MDLPQNNLPNSSPELDHVMKEMYKKNSELNDRNKTLALLRGIDEITLSSVTDPRQIAQQVSDLLVKEEFRMVGVLILKEDFLFPLAFSSNTQKAGIDEFGKKRFLSSPVASTQKNNLLVKAVNEKKVYVSHNFHDFLNVNFSSDEATVLQKQLGVESAIVYPVIVRGQVMGVLIIGIVEDEKSLSEYKKGLIDRLAGVVGIALDNSLLYQSIQVANDRLKQVDHLKDEFVSLASHELRTPMTIIRSYLWMFMNKKKGTLNEKEQRYLDRAYSSTERLINLVNDMLNVSRIESGRLKVEMKDIQIADIIDKVVTELVPRGQELGIKLSFVKPQQQMRLVHADPDRLEQVLINLIGNSFKFTPSGGAINVNLFPEEKNVLVQVADTGKGMKPEDIVRLFQKFGTMGGNYLHKPEAQGTGLGLYLSKSLVELQGGKIWAESKGKNQGSAFSFTLAYAKLNQAVPPAPELPSVAPSGSSGALASEAPVTVSVAPTSPAAPSVG